MFSHDFTDKFTKKSKVLVILFWKCEHMPLISEHVWQRTFECYMLITWHRAKCGRRFFVGWHQRCGQAPPSLTVLSQLGN